MDRSELAHVLRAACEVTGDPAILVVGSQSILGTFDDRDLPPEAMQSIEVDLAFFDDADERKSDLVDSVIGEASMFHETNGVYGQGVGLKTAVLPAGWRDRLVGFRNDETGSADALCLDPHDLVVSKLVAGREKDHEFARALLTAHLIDVATLRTRAALLESVPIPRPVARWIAGVSGQ